MAGRFAQARADGTYRPGSAGGQLISPAELVAAMSAFGGGARSGANGQLQGGAVLYDSTGEPLPFTAFRSGIDGGPGTPIQPRDTDPSRPPREFQFSPGWNLIPTPRGEGGMARFDELRALAMACSYFRIAVNYRKKQIRGLRWEISPKDAKTPAAKKKYQKDIDRVTAFFRRPNRVDNLRFGEWIGQALEELLTVDATVFFKYPAKNGKDLHSLVQIDGATIKQIIDEFGHVTGYQQILYGYPATQYPTYDPTTKTAIVLGEKQLAGRIAYIVTNPSVNNVYGTSTLEQLRPTIDVAIRRTARQLSWYQDGTVPDSFIEAPDAWVPDQIRQMQTIFDELYSGNEKLRAGMTVLPGGANYTPAKPFAYSKEEEEAIISMICANEGIPRSIFVSTTNRATGEMQRDESQDTGLKPLKGTLKDALDEFIELDQDAPDLEFTWVDTPAGNEWELAQAKALYVTSGIKTADEIRAEDGMDPLPEPDPAPAITLVPPLPGQQQPAVAGAPGKPAPKPGVPVAPKDDAAQKAELGTWERFARKRLEKGKHAAAFISTALPEDVSGLVVRGLAAAGTDAQVRAVFESARALIEKKKAHPLRDTRKKTATKHLADETLDLFEHQRKALMEVARERLSA